MKFFVEKNLQRLTSIKKTETKDFIDCSFALICGIATPLILIENFKVTQKCKFFIISHFVSALSNLMDGDKFIEAMEILGSVEFTLIQQNFRKINGICLSIFTDNYSKFSPKSLLLILENMKKIGIRHSTVNRALSGYAQKVEKILVQLPLVDLISFVKILNYCGNRRLEYLYSDVFQAIKQATPSNDKFGKGKGSDMKGMSYQELRFLLSSLLGCIKIANNNSAIKSVIESQLVKHNS